MFPSFQLEEQVTDAAMLCWFQCWTSCWMMPPCFADFSAEPAAEWCRHALLISVLNQLLKDAAVLCWFQCWTSCCISVWHCHALLISLLNQPLNDATVLCWFQCWTSFRIMPLCFADFSAEPAGGAAEWHEAGRGSPASHSGPCTASYPASADVRAQHPQPPGQPQPVVGSHGGWPQRCGCQWPRSAFRSRWVQNLMCLCGCRCGLVDNTGLGCLSVQVFPDIGCLQS